MKILLVSWYFPPSNTIAAVRLGKLARHLCARGHSLQVVTAADPPYPQSLAVEVDEGIVHRVPWKDVNAPANWGRDRIMALLRQTRRLTRPAAQVPAPVPAAPISPAGPESPAGTQGPAQGYSQAPSLGQRLSRCYELAANFPDSRIGWAPAAWRRGAALGKAAPPDGIFASGPPFTTLLVGYLVSRSTGAPLVVEFRDRWSEDPYYPPPAWRRALNRWLEGLIVRRAAGITTVSEPWAERFRERFGLPVAVIYNGFDEEDFAGLSPDGAVGSPRLRIVYTGGIYPGYRDPSPLFAAIAASPILRAGVEVLFYGTDRAAVMALAGAAGVTDNVQVHARVTHAEALKVQSQADLLLLMQWDDPKEQGNIPGKFAEYLGARRPILVLGLADGVPATVVRQRGAGIATTDPQALAQALERLLEQKRSAGQLPALTDAAVAGFSRGEQAARLEAFLQKVCARRR